MKGVREGGEQRGRNERVSYAARDSEARFGRACARRITWCVVTEGSWMSVLAVKK